MLIEVLLAVTALVGVGALLSRDELAPKVAFAGSLLPLAVSLLMWARYDGAGNALLDGQLLRRVAEVVRMADYLLR
jgi:NADH-quinone oxidoreductase subunit M